MVRDLTSNAPQSGYETPQNPFASDLDNENRYRDSNSSFGSSEEANFHSSPRSQYGNRFASSSGYYSQNGTSANLLSGQSSGDQAPALAVSAPLDNGMDPIQVPSEYDRYPSMAGSRVVSSTSLASQMKQEYSPNMGSTSDSATPDEDASMKSGNPFMTHVDFSPFGGYPASSFPLHIDEKEPDDYLHNPDPIADAAYDKNRFWYDLKTMDKRAAGGAIGVLFLLLGAIVVFVLLPVFFYSGVTEHYHPQSYEILSQYKYPLSGAIRTDLVDPDTPEDALFKENNSGEKWKLVFSDEFNAEGRTFYDGDDQFFQAVDIHYSGTEDLEWYDPDAVTTANGTLISQLDAYKNHDLFYRSGMVQSWNKMCFTQGMIFISAQLPNYGNKGGLWPGLWTMGNLGRPGYRASTEGVWPYTYDSCDAGITPNQSSPDGISYLPGQRLNSCTCAGEDHPNPGTGRGAPEIDIIEAETDTNDLKLGLASQSYQIAPMDIWYMPDYNYMEIHNQEVTSANVYTGGPIQQAVSGVTTLNNTWYERGDGAGKYQVYGYEYLNDNEDGHLTWYVGEDPTLTVHAKALGPNGNIGWRRLSKEPMAVVMNLGISNSWAYIDWPTMIFPAHLRVDYVRVYQPEDQINVTCDPDDFPTSDYIESHLEAYKNPNLTLWSETKYSLPKNKLTHKC
ncbi:hypothetical protein FT663_02784 [Candidozyma haemuli var. vulneris]|uniref:GH16 domain-containing protein n=1 Tax=Candidozyma haemuli TaxID=45357 RepID=A0A2V1AX49_9ASCO|nr:hypothetical protein CXQ85_005244 [[Candida] haemuloni]KAF3991283.1 hypothetical protein FT663_02784 [[Candida] haemuloni var. vulneris]KAF3991969.1 hypothetical protein FT662_01422 [[Candida] haemuloni var. vulneris]PVH22670.1 hypothetical protein CXQ85_005244 [[Candida] haemuloni]